MCLYKKIEQKHRLRISKNKRTLFGSFLTYSVKSTDFLMSLSNLSFIFVWPILPMTGCALWIKIDQSVQQYKSHFFSTIGFFTSRNPDIIYNILVKILVKFLFWYVLQKLSTSCLKWILLTNEIIKSRFVCTDLQHFMPKLKTKLFYFIVCQFQGLGNHDLFFRASWSLKQSCDGRKINWFGASKSRR